MGANNSKTAEAAALDESPETPAGAGEFSPEVMTNVFAKFGRKPPVAVAAAAGEQQDKGGDADAGKGDDGQAAAGAEAGAGDAGGEAAAGQAGEGEQAEAGAGDDGQAAADAEAGEGEQAGAADAAATEEQAAQLREETARLLKTKLKDLPPETRNTVQSFMDQRIAAITGKAKSENDRLATRVTELTGEVDTLRKDGPVPVQIAGIHPALLAENPGQIDQELQKIEQFEDWADQYRNGYNLPDDDNFDRKQPSYTADEIRARSRELRREKDRVLPAARQKLADQAKQDEQLKAVLPALFNPASAEYAQARQLLKTHPQLRARADQNVIIAQLILGQRALQQLQNSGRKPGDSATNAGRTTANGTKPPLRKAPRAPGGGAPAFGSPLDRPNQRPAPEAAVKQFSKNPTREGLKTAVRSLVFSNDR